MPAGTAFAALRDLWGKMPRSRKALLLGILALGVFLRAFRLNLFELKGDELGLILSGLQASGHHWWITHGSVSSVQIPSGPGFTYIMGLLTALSPNPYTLTSFILAANIAILLMTLPFFAVFARDGNRFLLCVFLFSLSPFMIMASRKIWEPSVILLFAIPLVLLAIRVHRDQRLFVPIGILSSIVFQIYNSGVFFVLLLALFIFFTRERKSDDATQLLEGSPETVSFPAARHRFLWAAAGLAAFTVLLVPYLSFFLFHLRSTGLPGFFTRKQGTCIVGSLKWVLFTGTGNYFWYLTLSHRASEWNWPFPPLPGLLLYPCYLLVIPFVAGFYKYAHSFVSNVFPRLARRSGSANGPAQASTFRAGELRTEEMLCPAFIAFFFVVFCFVLDVARPHHYMIIVPFLILALSEGTLSMMESAKRSGRKTVRVLVCAALISYAVHYPLVFSYLNAYNGSKGDYGIVYREQLRVARKVAALGHDGQVRLNPLIMTATHLPFWRRLELQRSIAYICRTDFGVNVVYNSPARRGADRVVLIQEGRKLKLVLRRSL